MNVKLLKLTIFTRENQFLSKQQYECGLAQTNRTRERWKSDHPDRREHITSAGVASPAETTVLLQLTHSIVQGEEISCLY